MSKPDDIPQDVRLIATDLILNGPVSGDLDDICDFEDAIAKSIMAERRNSNDLAIVLNDILDALKKEAPGTPLNNHKYVQLGIRAYDAIRKHGPLS